MGKVTSTAYTDRVLTGIVSGQSADDFARRAEALAHGFGALLCRVRSAHPGWLVWSSSAATPWPQSSPPCPSPSRPTCRRGDGRREDGSLWLVRLQAPTSWSRA